MAITRLRRIALIAPIVATVAALAVPPASADGIADGPAAALSNALQITSDGSHNAGESLSSDNISCDLGQVYGGPVNQRTPYVIGEIYGQDFAVGELTCASLERNKSYTVTVTVSIQAFDGANWFDVATSSGSMSAVSGAASARAVAVGQYPAFSAALNKYHRGYIVATTSTGRSYRLSTPTVWYMAA